MTARQIASGGEGERLPGGKGKQIPMGSAPFRLLKLQSPVLPDTPPICLTNCV